MRSIKIKITILLSILCFCLMALAVLPMANHDKVVLANAQEISGGLIDL